MHGMSRVMLKGRIIGTTRAGVGEEESSAQGSCGKPAIERDTYHLFHRRKKDRPEFTKT